MQKAKITDLKKYLSNYNENELKQEIIELFKLYPNVKEYFSIKIVPDAEKELLEKYKKIIENEFFPDRGFGKLRYSVMKKALADFKKIAKSPTNIADLMVSYVEYGVAFTNSFGDINEKFYNNILNMYEDAWEYVVKENIYKIFQERLRETCEDGQDIGWGFSDGLLEIYYSYLGEEEDY